MQPYSPADLEPAQHVALREGLRIAALRDGLSEDAAEEAASVMYLHWLARDWSKGSVSRGDHARAFYSIRAYARRSFWHGFTGQRRAARGKRVPRDSAGNPVKVSVSKATREEIESRQRRRESMIPGPVDHAMAWEAVENQPWTKKAKRIGELAFATGLTPRQVFDMASGAENAPRFSPAPVPAACPGGPVVRTLPYDAAGAEAVAEHNRAAAAAAGVPWAEIPAPRHFLPGYSDSRF
jgi:hypothetical protein